MREDEIHLVQHCDHSYWPVLICSQMSDMQQNFDEQLAGKESEVNCRVDNMSQKHKSELSGVLTQFMLLLSLFTVDCDLFV